MVEAIPDELGSLHHSISGLVGSSQSILDSGQPGSRCESRDISVPIGVNLRLKPIKNVACSRVSIPLNPPDSRGVGGDFD
jgi:hypothetical protein